MREGALDRPSRQMARSKSLVVDRLRENPHTRDSDIKVDVKRGMVILGGEVEPRTRLELYEEAKRRDLPGSRRWAGPSSPGRSDIRSGLHVVIMVCL
jgi:hypothetical protein